MDLLSHITHGTIRQVSLIDQLGRTVLTAQELPNGVLDISSLAAGTYMVKVITHEGMALRKLMKQ